MGIKASFNRPTGSVPAGSYRAMLADVEDCEIDNQWGKKEGIKFKYVVEWQGKEYTIVRRIAKTVSDRGYLFKDLKAMLGDKLTADVLKDDERLAAAINSCIGQFYLVVCAVSDQGWTNIDSVVALPSGETPPSRGPSVQAVGGRERPQPQPTKQQALKTGFEEYPDADADNESAAQNTAVPFEDDEIPF